MNINYMFVAKTTYLFVTVSHIFAKLSSWFTYKFENWTQVITHKIISKQKLIITDINNKTNKTMVHPLLSISPQGKNFDNDITVLKCTEYLFIEELSEVSCIEDFGTVGCVTKYQCLEFLEED